MRIDGWIFDVYLDGPGARLWVITPEGRAHSFVDPWRPSFLVEDGAVHRAERWVRAAAPDAVFAPREKTDLFTGQPRRMWEITVPASAHGPLIRRLRGLDLPLANADIPLAQLFHYERGHFPLARGTFEVAGDRLLSWALRDDPAAVDYALPPLTVMHIALGASDPVADPNPHHRIRGGLRLTYENDVHELEGTWPEQVDTLGRRLRDWDPDVITSDWGDGVLIPRLMEEAARQGRPLPFCRDSRRPPAGRGTRSFQSYGRTVHQAGAVTFFGRWHLDLKNSFYFKKCGFDGLFEIARLSKLPVQKAARSTIGTALSSMQLDRALRKNILIPLEKQQAEDFRPASLLVSADKGGLVYEAPVGWYDRVVEYDFSSMYPALMVKHNISPETVNCPCCPDNPVPEIGHHLCRNRRGLVPEVLAPLLEKRAEYKRLAKTDSPHRGVYKNRANAHKWALVCCFGYLGFKNARFGKIEAHESVTAWGRETLLRAKEAVERRGYRVLHAIVDSLWVADVADDAVEPLRRAIEAEAESPVALEGVYKWVRFCPSKTDPLSGVPARYFGAFTNGDLKIRGLALRRRDTPPLFKALQERMLRLLASADSVAACRALVPALAEIVQEAQERLREGRVSLADLAITCHLSRDPADYVHDTLTSLAAKQLAASGVVLHPGESMKYIIRSAGDKWKEGRVTPLVMAEEQGDYDHKKYLEKLKAAEAEVAGGLAFDEVF